MREAIVVIILGISAWTVALVIALAIGASGHAIATCLFGIFLGVMGLRYTIRKSRKRN